MALGADLPRLWEHPGATAATRKRILRAVLEGIIVTVEPGRLRLVVHWKGGDHTSLEVVKNRSGQHRWKTSTATEQLIRDLSRLLPDGSIASVLNRLGIRTAKGHTWTEQRIRGFRNEHQIAVYRDGERAERGEIILHEAATRLGVQLRLFHTSQSEKPRGLSAFATAQSWVRWPRSNLDRDFAADRAQARSFYW